MRSNDACGARRNRPDVVAQWSDKGLAIRWLRVFPGRRLEEHLGKRFAWGSR